MRHSFICLVNRSLIPTAICGRSLSTSKTMISIENLNVEGTIVKFSLNRPPVQSLNLELLQDLTSEFSKLETNHKVQGVVISSSTPKLFCAGLGMKSHQYQYLISN